MPSLEEWDKYLQEQEEALLKSLESNTNKNISSDINDTHSPKVELIALSDQIPDENIRRVVELRHTLPTQLFNSDTKSEVAQNSYVSFKESRDELLHRLLDPQISLEDAARILNVCPTTVRRYTNKGLLKHYRTNGNQRRFKLSDVLAFLETQSKLTSKYECNNTETGII
ncbi:MAG: helix-turn-helix domain-containing protein [Armatimonadota bacterium]